MKVTGEMIINAICKRLAEEDIRTYDSAIVNKLRSLNYYETLQLFTFGDVQEWHNDRLNK